MTTLTMIWNDRHCAGMSEHHWHTMEFAEDRATLKHKGDWEMCVLMVNDYYETKMDDIVMPGETTADIAKAALEDIGIVGIFVGTLEEL